MEYKIAYIKDFDNDGCCFRQRIRCQMSEIEFNQVNLVLRNCGKFFARALNVGKNYATNTTTKIFVEHFGIDKDKRYIDWTNTVINIKIN